MQSPGGRCKRVFMLSSQPMFSRGVETLLRERPEIQVVGREKDLQAALSQIRELKPDVVILDTREPGLYQVHVAARILREVQGVCVFALNLQDESLAIYRQELRCAHGIQDLVQAIQEESEQDVSAANGLGASVDSNQAESEASVSP